MGDAMADWLAYGLEEAYADQPDFGVVRRTRDHAGLIGRKSRSASHDWVASAPELLAQEKPDFVVVLLGLADRIPFRELQGAQARGGQEAGPAVDGPQQPRPKAVDHEFRSGRWGELYTRRIDDMIAVLKGTGAAVLWVGLPPVRGPRSRGDLAFLNDLYRARAQKAGFTYVDVWDGFVDEDGRFSIRGPDYDGQIRQLRSPDGVYFTKDGARKLGHYVEREIQRLITARTKPIALPSPEPQPPIPARPGGPMPRAVAGPVIPLTTVQTPGELAGGGQSPVSTPDPVARRVLIRGKAVPSVAGRADDFSWPRKRGENQEAIPPVSTATPRRPPSGRPSSRN
jgi:lysophospholipase L1-like esterase